VNFYTFCINGNRHEYSAKELQHTPLHLNCVSTLPGETKNDIKRIEHACKINLQLVSDHVFE